MSNDLAERPIVVMDFETTGIDPRIHDIIEIGAIRVTQRLEVLSSFLLRVAIQHPQTVQPKALEVNGYNPEDWADAACIADAVIDFTDFCQDGIFCAWNITFEYRFLMEAFRRTAIKNPFLERRYSHHIDIPSIVWSQAGPDLKSLNYDMISQRLGIPPEVKPHRAINGAKHNLDMLRALLPGRAGRVL